MFVNINFTECNKNAEPVVILKRNIREPWMGRERERKKKMAMNYNFNFKKLVFPKINFKKNLQMFLLTSKKGEVGAVGRIHFPPAFFQQNDGAHINCNFVEIVSFGNVIHFFYVHELYWF